MVSVSARPIVRFTPVHGTWHRRAPWTNPTSDLMVFLQDLNLVQLTPDDPFYWSGDVNGWQFWRRWGWGNKDGDQNDWLAGGAALRWKLTTARYEDRGLLVHSHGLWPAIIAMAQGLEVPWLVSVGSPVRCDMEDYIRKALPNLASWLHIYDLREDGWGQSGGIGDGRISLDRAQRFAGVHNLRGTRPVYTTFYPRRGGNDAVAGIRHSDILNEPEHFKLWQSRRWVDFMAPAQVLAS